ncbi:hypothetical protein M8C21_013324 [Ambrosia artemisiifolia]|uniref:AB hydrolase-1 domain-containing protein n=1 Tax=Ambrosia artemisiifolia TaxID=4212 RepID=A0AAD5G749_AMBAR|nr:hypothetical protein M8C21_013324 [Ambrosia artemisiifolia]
MPRSSRSKSHKQSKHREYSGSDEDVKVKEKSSSNNNNNGKDDVGSVRVSKSSTVSGERRKHDKDLLNGDRWNGGGSSDDKGMVVIDIGDKEDESKSGSRGEKRKSEKDYVRKDKEREREKEKEYKEMKDKDRGSDKGRKGHGDKVEAEASLKQGEGQSSKKGKEVSDWPIEEELRNPELEKELEKRMRRRGEASSAKDKYQDDIKETEDRQLSTRSDRSKDERHKNEEYGDIRETRQKDEKHREDGERDRKSRDVKHRGESGRYNKHRDDKYHEDKYSEDGNKETKYKDDKYMENSEKDERSRDRKRRQDDDRDYKHKEEKKARDSKYRDVPEAKRLKDDNDRKTNNRDGSPVYDDRVARYKDDKDSRRGNEKDESSDYRSRSSMKEPRSESEKRSSAKADSVSEWGRHGSRYADVEISASHSRRRSSPSGSSYSTRDHHRFSKQEETKFRDYAYEDRARHNVHSSRDYESVPGQSDKKVSTKDDGYMGAEFSGEKRLRPDSRSSPQVDKSPSSTSNERRNLIKSDARKSLDLEEPGPRSGGYKDTVKDGKGSRELVNEAHPSNDIPQVDNDNLSVSSPYARNSHFSGNSKSLLPPPSPSTFRTGSDGPFYGSTEDDRSKSNNRHRRMADTNMNRGQSQGQGQGQGNWNNVPNWPSPMAPGGYIPFQHVPPPMFHPLMPQFPPQIFGRPPMKLNPGLPYPVPDHGRPLAWRNQVDESVPPSLHGWDANNAVFGDESHLYGRLDWDHRTQLSNRGWDQNGEMWKNQNAGGGMEMQSGQQKDGYSGQRSNDENWSGLTGQPDEGEQNQPDMQPETLNLDKNGPEAQKVTESPQVFEVVKEDNSALISQAYLSRVDVSKDLTQPELYEQCTSMMDLDQEAISDEFDFKILFLEDGVNVDVTDNASLFSVTDDSVFQKAMFLYKKQKEDFRLTNTDAEKGGSEDNNSADEMAAEGTVVEYSKENEETTNKPEGAITVEVGGAVVKQEEEHESTEVAVKESPAPCEIEEASESINDEKNGGGGPLVLSDLSTADVAVMPTDSVEFGSVVGNLALTASCTAAGVDGILSGHQNLDNASTENVIFLHGFMSSSYIWTETIFPELDSSKYRLFAVDLLGFGSSPKPRDCLYTLNDHLEMVEKSVIREFDLNSFHLVAHSMGCIIALALAAKYPNSLKSITLVAPPYFLTSEEEDPSEIALKRLAYKSVWPPLLFGSAFMTWKPSFLVMDLFRHTHHSAWHTMHNVICGGAKMMDPCLEILRLVGARVTVVQGSRDQVVPVECSNNIKVKVPDAEVKIITDANHNTVIMGREKQFAAELELIWDSVTDAKG